MSEPNHDQKPLWDVLVIGGGPAGLSAALILARAQRRVLICDVGQPRNRRSDAIGGFLTRDGMTPADLLRLAREDLRSYKAVELRANTEVREVGRCAEGFEIETTHGDRVVGRKILIATGVTDELPAVAGFDALYGRSAWHCPYCDGYRHRDQRIAVYGRSDAAEELALELTGWTSQIVIVSNGPCGLNSAKRRRLSRNGISLRETPIARLEGTDGRIERILFADGGFLQADALFFGPMAQPILLSPGNLGLRSNAMEQ